MEYDPCKVLAEMYARKERAHRLFNHALQMGLLRLADMLRMKVVLADENYAFAIKAHRKHLSNVCGDWRTRLKRG